MWRLEGFWEEQFYTSVFDAVRTMSRPYKSSRDLTPATPATPMGKVGGGEGGEGGGAATPLPSASGRVSPSALSSPASAASTPAHAAAAASYRPGSTDWTYAYEQTIGSQLLAIAHNMSTFGACGAV